MKVISFRVTTETYNQLEALATNKAETVSDTARKILAGHFDGEKSKEEFLKISGLLTSQTQSVARVLELAEADFKNARLFQKQVRESLKIEQPALAPQQQK